MQLVLATHSRMNSNRVHIINCSGSRREASLHHFSISNNYFRITCRYVGLCVSYYEQSTKILLNLGRGEGGGRGEV